MRITNILSRAVRCPDPFFRIEDSWIVRRLAPLCSRIELAHLKKSDDQQRLLTAMGAETADIHIASCGDREVLIAYLNSLPKNWQEHAGEGTAEAMREDWETWCREKPK